MERTAGHGVRFSSGEPIKNDPTEPIRMMSDPSRKSLHMLRSSIRGLRSPTLKENNSMRGKVCHPSEHSTTYIMVKMVTEVGVEVHPVEAGAALAFRCMGARAST